MKWNTWSLMTIAPALGLVLTLTAGCSEETQEKMGEAAEAGKDAAKAAMDDAKDAGGEMAEKLKDTASGVADKTEQMAGDIKDKLADQQDELKDAADGQADALKDQAADALGGDLKAKADEMIAKIKDMIETKDFGGAQALLDQLKGMPGLDQLGAIQDQIGNLQGLIDKGKQAADAAAGMMGK